MVTGGNAYSDDNFGTLLTPELMQWTIDKLSANSHLAGINPAGQAGANVKPDPSTSSRGWKSREKKKTVSDYTIDEVTDVRTVDILGSTIYEVFMNDGN